MIDAPNVPVTVVGEMRDREVVDLVAEGRLRRNPQSALQLSKDYSHMGHGYYGSGASLPVDPIGDPS